MLAVVIQIKSKSKWAAISNQVAARFGAALFVLPGSSSEHLHNLSLRRLVESCRLERRAKRVASRSSLA